LARPDSVQRFFSPPETFRESLLSVRFARVFLLVAAKFLRSGPGRRVQLPIPLSPTREAFIILDGFCGADESGLQFTPDWANHECLATIVARAPNNVQQA
jgi:hypothetical protein